MKINVENKSNVQVIKLKGDLDGSTAGEAREEITSYISSDSKLVFDMSECEYISSAGLRVLLIIAKRLKAVGGYGVLASLLEEVKDIMEMTGFSHILTSYETVNEAISAVGKENKKVCCE